MFCMGVFLAVLFEDVVCIGAYSTIVQSQNMVCMGVYFIGSTGCHQHLVVLNQLLCQLRHSATPEQCESVFKEVTSLLDRVRSWPHLSDNFFLFER